jgi:hypothetical protein
LFKAANGVPRSVGVIDGNVVEKLNRQLVSRFEIEE